MCGLAGVVDFSGRPLDVGVLRRMTALQSHRGPDDFQVAGISLRRKEARLLPLSGDPDGSYEAGLGFRRLSIQDVSEAGRQPMLSEDGSVAIVFNGEIYNAFTYVRELEALGHRFRGRSDTEVLLAMYLAWDIEGLLSRVNGMFAFALVDLRRGRVVLARDHLGIKPLYSYRDGDLFLFASEVKAFLAHPGFRAELDRERLDEYLVFRSLATQTLLKSVSLVPAGTYWVLEGGAVREARYWSVPERSPEVNGRGLEDATTETGRRLRQAVRGQLISDVRLGCQLSGGVDSSMISRYAAEESGGRMDAFSVVFEDASYSEEPWVRLAAERCAVSSHLFLLDAGYFQENLERATWHLDGPLTHPSSLGILLLAEQASRSVTVLLSGEGADELFGGYTRQLDAVMRPRMKPLLPILTALPVLGRIFRAHFSHGGADDAEDFILASAVMPPSSAGALYPGFDRSRALRGRRELYDAAPGRGLTKALAYELRTYLEPLLIRQDKMTMASSVENRVPFLDRELVEFVWARLPESALVRKPFADPWNVRRCTKIVVKRLAAEVFGEDFAYRRKVGFGIPLAAFLSGARLDERVREEILPSMKARGLLDCEVMGRAWDSFTREPGRSPGAQEVVWSGLSLEMFLRLFVDGKHGKDTAAA